MTRYFIDLSVAIENDVPSDPPPLMPKITYMSHRQTFHQIGSFFPGLAPADLPDGEGWAVETMAVSPSYSQHGRDSAGRYSVTH
jgi:hypothetical protein